MHPSIAAPLIALLLATLFMLLPLALVLMP